MIIMHNYRWFRWFRWFAGRVASCEALDGKHVQSRAGTRWTRGPSDCRLTHVAKRSLSESIRTVRSRVITVLIIRDRTIKIQRTRLHEAYPHTYDEIASRLLIHDRTIIKRRIVSINRRAIRAVDHDKRLQPTADIKFRSFKCVLRDEKNCPR